MTIRLPPVIGHRGAAARAPENTLAGLRRAKALGCAWVEFDVRLTADGTLVLCHDARLDRTTDRTGPVASQSLSTIRQSDAGSWFGPVFAGEPVPTLNEAMALAVELDLGVNIEMKADPGREYATAAAVAVALRRLGPRPPLFVSSFLPNAVAVLRDLAPRTVRGLLLRSVARGSAEIAKRLGC
ncbi:MAG: glycerophosphodiester phosphodiesterase family protein, partial [Alphaproteobacteria bacterium]